MKVKNLCFLSVLLLLGACSPFSFFSSGMTTLDATSQERGLGGYVTDTEIQTRLNVLYFQHDHILQYRINIAVYEGRILLTGVLPTKKLQEDAIRLAWQVPGVKTVIDETMVGEKRTLAEYGSDKLLTTKINGKLFFDGKVSSRNYEIVVVKGIVYLVGLASNEEELNQVLELCRTTTGVKKVVSYVRLMNLYERRRRQLFNKRKGENPLERNQKEKKIAREPHKAEGSWEQGPKEENSDEDPLNRKHP
ncbi:MAG: BON domain-containing protein [Alphaproteobacteria bacterium]